MLIKIYAVANLRHSKCTNPNHDEFGHLCEEMIELKAACNSDNRVKIAEELADVVIVAVMFANKLNIDLTIALEEKTAKNFKNGRLGTLDVIGTRQGQMPQYTA